MKNIKDTVKELLKEKGNKFIQNPKLFCSIIDDKVSGYKNERNVLRTVLTLHKEICDYLYVLLSKDVCDSNEVVDFRYLLENDFGFNDKWIDIIFDIFDLPNDAVQIRQSVKDVSIKRLVRSTIIMTITFFVGCFLGIVGTMLYANNTNQFISLETVETDNYSFDSSTQILTVHNDGYFYGDFKKFKGSFDGFSPNVEKVIIDSGVVQIKNDAFKYCSHLLCVEIPHTMTKIGGSAFAYCTNLKNMEIPEEVTYVGGSVFAYCKNLESIKFLGEVTALGGYAFNCCTSLTSITIPQNLTILNEGIFKDCINLKSIEMPASIRKIGNYTLDGCVALTSVNIPDSVISIGNSAFNECTSLKSITIPKSVSSMGDAVFYGWTENQTIYMEGRNAPPSTWEKSWNYGCNAKIIWDT